MNYLLKIYLCFFFIVFLLSCEKESNKTPGCEVTGLWIGTWESPGNASGTFFSPVSQNNTELTGNVYIRFNLPSLENHGVEFSGSVTDKNVKSTIEISEIKIKISGNINADTAVSGTFNVANGTSGTFKGIKITTSIPEVKEIFNSKTGLASINNIGGNLWVWTGEGFDQGWNDYKYVVKRFDYNGTFIDSFLFPRSGGSLGNSISFDGQIIWELDDGNRRIYTYDLSGNRLDTFQSPANYSDAIACIESKVYITDGFNRVTHILNSDAQEQNTIPNEYISIFSLCEYNGSLLMGTDFYNTLMQTNMNGKILRAFTLPERILSVCSNGVKVWCLTEEYIANKNGPGSSVYKIYEVQIN